MFNQKREEIVIRQRQAKGKKGQLKTKVKLKTGKPR